MGKIPKSKFPKKGQKVIQSQKVDIKLHKMEKIRKSKFPKMVNKSFKIRKLRINHIKWENSKNQNCLKGLKSH